MPSMQSMIAMLSAWCLSLSMGWAQTNPIPEEAVAFDSPEGWAMAYMIASSLNLGTAPPRATRPAQWRLSGEVGSIPTLSEEQQKVGFGGFKNEDLNKSPVFGRLRASVGIIWDITAEIAYTPPINIDGAQPTGLWGAALSRPLINRDHWGVGVRVFAQQGQVRADVTCSAEVAQAPTFTADNPFGCIAPSKDRLTLDHHGAEVMLSIDQGPFGVEPWVGLAVARMTPTVQVDARLQSGLERYTLRSQGTTKTLSFGLGYSINTQWRAHVASSYTPLDAKRPTNNTAGRDDFWNLRFGLTWTL